MALKPDRLLNKFADDISFFMDETAEPGGIVSLSTGGSGAAMDQAVALVTYSATSSGKVPLGVLMQPMVDKDLTQNKLNPYSNEVQKGGKVRINRDCVITTNMIYPGLTPAAGAKAYLSTSGLVHTTQANTVANPYVGYFLSSKDADGYCKVRVQL